MAGVRGLTAWTECVEGVARRHFGIKEFGIEDLYALEHEIVQMRGGEPNPPNLRARIRQALQDLRHKKRLSSMEAGRYRLLFRF